LSAWSRFAGEPYCYLTTTGRVSGRPHQIEIWFAIDGGTLYMLSGGGERSDWVKNLLVHDKYAGSDAGDLSGWRRSALPIAVALERDQPTTEGGSQ
jgi:hypothetical protein